MACQEHIVDFNCLRVKLQFPKLQGVARELNIIQCIRLQRPEGEIACAVRHGAAQQAVIAFFIGAKQQRQRVPDRGALRIDHAAANSSDPPVRDTASCEPVLPLPVENKSPDMYSKQNRSHLHYCGQKPGRSIILQRGGRGA